MKMKNRRKRQRREHARVERLGNFAPACPPTEHAKHGDDSGGHAPEHALAQHLAYVGEGQQMQIDREKTPEGVGKGGGHEAGAFVGVGLRERECGVAHTGIPYGAAMRISIRRSGAAIAWKPSAA